MPFSKNINTYADVVSILTTARAHGKPVRYELSSPGAAMNWVQRAFYYRKLLTNAARARAGNVPGFIPTTDWDDVLLTREGNVIIIAFGRVKGKLTDAEGGEELALTAAITTGSEAETIIRDIKPKAEPQPDNLDLGALESIAASLVREKGE